MSNIRPTVQARNAAVGATIVAGLALRANGNLPAVYRGMGPVVDPETGKLDYVRLWQIQRSVEEYGRRRDEANRSLEVHSPLTTFYRRHRDIETGLVTMLNNKGASYNEAIRNLEAAIESFDLRILRVKEVVEKFKTGSELTELRQRLKAGNGYVLEGQVEAINQRIARLNAAVEEIMLEKEQAVELLSRIRREQEEKVMSLAPEFRYGLLELVELGKLLDEAKGSVNKLERLEAQISTEAIEKDVRGTWRSIDSCFESMHNGQMKALGETLRGSGRIKGLVTEVYGLVNETNELVTQALKTSRKIDNIAIQVRDSDLLNKNTGKLYLGIAAGQFTVPSGDLERLNRKITQLNSIASTKIKSSAQGRRLEERAAILKDEILADAQELYDTYKHSKPSQTITGLQIFANTVLDLVNGVSEFFSGLKSIRKLFTTGLLVLAMFNALNFTAPNIARADPGHRSTVTRRAEMTKQQMYEYFANNHYRGLRQFRDLSLTQAEFNDINELYLYITRNLDPNMTRDEFCKLFGFQGTDGICLVGNGGPGWLPRAARHMVELKKGLKVINNSSARDETKAAAIGRYREGLQTLFESAKKEHDRYSLASVLRKRALRSLGN